VCLQVLEEAGCMDAALLDGNTRARGGGPGQEEERELEDLVNHIANRDFLEAHGLHEPVDEAEMEDAPHAPKTGWSDERLDLPLHAHTDVTVREFVYSVMSACTGTVRANTMDDIIKIIRRVLPGENNAPG
jgi:hypothetical protein